MSYIHAPSVVDVLTRLHEKIEDIPALAERYKHHTFAEYYQLLVDETVDELLNVPVERTCLGLDPLEDEEDMQESVGELATVIASLFDKAAEVVEEDIIESIIRDANKDIRIARINRHLNLLH